MIVPFCEGRLTLFLTRPKRLSICPRIIIISVVTFWSAVFTISHINRAQILSLFSVFLSFFLSYLFIYFGGAVGRGRAL